MSRGTGLTLIGSRFDPDTRRPGGLGAESAALELARPGGITEAEQILRGLDVPVADLPIIIVPGGPDARNPGSRALLDALAISGNAGSYPPGVCDLLVVGAGPAGLAASVYGASDGMATTLAEDTALGGQAGTSSRIENYLGFPLACPGRNSRPGGRCRRRSSAFASSWPLKLPHYPSRTACTRSHSMTARPFSQVGRHRHWRTVQPASPGSPGRVRGRRGVLRSDPGGGPGLRQRPVAIVGGGNSAGQAALFLSRSCVAVHLIIRRDALDASMSRYLVDRIERNPGIVVWPSTVGLTGTNHLEAVRLRRADQPEASELAVTGLFVFIGAKPGTGWLAGQLAEDEHGFLLTGSDIPTTRLENEEPDTIVSGDQQARHIRHRRRAQRLRQARRSRHR